MLQKVGACILSIFRYFCKFIPSEQLRNDARLVSEFTQLKSVLRNCFKCVKKFVKTKVYIGICRLVAAGLPYNCLSVDLKSWRDKIRDDLVMMKLESGSENGSRPEFDDLESSAGIARHGTSGNESLFKDGMLTLGFVGKSTILN